VTTNDVAGNVNGALATLDDNINAVRDGISKLAAAIEKS